MNYEQFRRNSEYWSRMTYSEGFPGRINLNEHIKNETIACLGELGRLNRTMDGNSIVSLPRDNQAEVRGDINYTALFHSMTTGNSFFSPAYFAYRIVEQYMNNTGAYDRRIAKGYICRGFRTLASFFREMCLEYKLNERLPGAIITVGAEQDINEHTDLKVFCNGNDFRIWSYQCNNLTNTAAKIKGVRGALPFGLFLLCPLDIDIAPDIENVYGWYMYSDSYVDRVVSVMRRRSFNNADRYNDVILGRSDAEIKAYIRQIRVFVK